MPDQRIEGESAAIAIAEAVRVRFGAKEVRLGESVDDLVQRADAKLCEAKVAGRDRVATFANGPLNGR